LIMKANIEDIVFGFILAPLAPLAGLLGFWWASYALLPEKWISVCALSGLALGILADILVLKRMIAHAPQYGMVFWITVFLFYTVGIFGFFMGMPVFNAALGIPAGFIVGGKLVRKMADKSQIRSAGIRTSLFTTIILTGICATSATLALNEATLPSQLEGMLGLPFPVTWDMVWGIILVGGSGLLVINWLLTSFTVRYTCRFLSIS